MSASVTRATALLASTNAPAIPHMVLLLLSAEARRGGARGGTGRRREARVRRARHQRVAAEARILRCEFTGAALDGECGADAAARGAAHPRELLAVAVQQRQRLG